MEEKEHEEESILDFRLDPRFKDIEPFENRIWLSSPTMHGNEQKWVSEAIRSNWVSTIGENINEIERQVAEKVGCKYAVGLGSGTVALHLAIKLAGEKIYGQPRVGHGTLEGKRVFCSDMTFAASVNPVAYENGEAVFIDSERDTWNMDPIALEKAFSIYPYVRLVVIAHLYGTPAKMEEIKAVCDKHQALIIEDAAESFGAFYKLEEKWVETGSLGDFNCISFNGNKIITGSSGGMFFTDSKEDAAKVRKWSTQSRENAPWYQHKELGYNYRMSNIVAGVVRGQLPWLEDHIELKRKIWERYRDGLKDLPVSMNPWDEEKSRPNFWLSCLLIDKDALAPSTRSDTEAHWTHVTGKSSPSEILEALKFFNAEGRPIWKPMHLQPIYRKHPFMTITGNNIEKTNDDLERIDINIGEDIFSRGLCLPSDNKMTPTDQEKIIEIIHRCFE